MYRAVALPLALACWVVQNPPLTPQEAVDLHKNNRDFNVQI